jgi:hypothetical protein
MKKSLWQRKSEPNSVSACAIGAIFVIVLLGFTPVASIASDYTADGLKIRTTVDGRIDSLKMGSGLLQDIDFAEDELGNPLTGGFYVRDFTIETTTSLPTGVINLIPANAAKFQPGTIDPPSNYWTEFTYGAASDVEELDLNPFYDNHVARLHVDEIDNGVGGYGWYAGL